MYDHRTTLSRKEIHITRRTNIFGSDGQLSRPHLVFLGALGRAPYLRG